MPTNMIDRSAAGALIPDEYVREIFKAVTENSAALALMRRLPNMSRKETKLAVTSALATAGFIGGDTGLKPLSSAGWINKIITAEEIAVIIPIPEAVLDDADYDIWAEVKPQIIEAFGKVIDAAMFFGVDAPTSWPAGVVPAAVAAGKSIALGTADDIALDVSDGMSLVETSGYEVTGFAAAMSTKAQLRGLRDLSNALLFQPSLTVGTPATLYGQPIHYPRNGAWDASQALMLGGDFKQAVYAVRQDMTYKLLTEAVITDSNNEIIYNLAQQDMVALRCVMRLGWQLPNPINRMDENATTRYPFFVLQPAAQPDPAP